jgi:hypothetical protein
LLGVRTSFPRKQGKPIESVKLSVTFEGDKKSLSKVKKAVPESTWKGDELLVEIEGEDPLVVARTTKELSDRVRSILEGKPAQKDFKQSERVAAQK